jgi:ABC exporter DevB family membrane fusion protein
MNRTLLIRLLAIGAVVLVVAAVVIARRPAPAATPDATLRRDVAAEGKVEARPGYDVRIGSDLYARIARVPVNEGDAVQQGQVVVQLDNRDLVARQKEAQKQLAVAEARLAEIRSGSRPEEVRRAQAELAGAQVAAEQARREYERYRELRQKGMVNASALDEKERAFKVAEANLEQARQSHALVVAGPKPESVRVQQDAVVEARASVDYFSALVDKTTLRSPINGRVTQRFLDAGESVTPETPILSIVDLNHLWINVEVDETDVGRLHVGDPATVTSAAFPGRIFHGTVQQIADYVGPRAQRPEEPSVNLGLKVVQTKVVLAEPSPLKIGMTVDVRITPP